MNTVPLIPVQSWGRIGAPAHELVIPWTMGQAQGAIRDSRRPWHAFGLGRSYGDVALNEGGRLINTTKLDRFLSFDCETGVLEAEAGVSLEDIIRLILPQGWFLPTTPGTKYVTLAGAIANDVHGKNHHRVGTFGCHVLSLELARSDGSVHKCSPAENQEMFRATIGGLGMTGLITRATLQLTKVPGAYLDSEEVPFSSLDEFFAMAADSDADKWEHTVAWMDCVGRSAGRGIFMRANWADGGNYRVGLDGLKVTVPMQPPSALLNSLTMKMFNEGFYRAKSLLSGRKLQHYNPCFYPLDSILKWNLMYGRPGFYQYQCVFPKAVQREAMGEMLKLVSASGQASFLVVIKVFGDKSSPGYLSFPMPGTNLALDLPNRGEVTHKLFARMDAIVAEAKGRIYPCKDGRMPSWIFKRGYPEWEKVEALRDPNVRSDMWNRVTAALLSEG
jgi:FAD/FMN-containing dehydrogenase